MCQPYIESATALSDIYIQYMSCSLLAILMQHGSKSMSRSGPSLEIRINLCISQQIFILFKVENPLSQSAVETGKIRAILSSYVNVG